jgi:F-type H+-transporting ATPase subunit b
VLSLALVVVACLALTTGASVTPASAQPHTEPAQAEHQGDHGEGHSDRGLVDVIARLVNFGILAGTLWYLLRSPLTGYLATRGQQVRADLVNAAELKQQAGAQIVEIDRKMSELPRDLEMLRAEGAKEIAAEEARITAAAAAERDRLLEQARREIALQVKIAERDLVAHAANLAVGVASERIKQTITDDDRQRLVDRYVAQLETDRK